jgi:6-phosphogluconolactonase
MVGYLGTYTEAAFNGSAAGIYSFTLNPESGAVEQFRLAAKTVNPSFLAAGPKYLYAVNEVDEFEGRPGGGVTAFARAGDGALHQINQVPSEGKSPCHVVLNDAGTWAVVSNYASGTAAVLPVHPDGSLGQAAQVIVLSGSGPHAERQEGPHAHSFFFDKTYTHGFICDLGSDRLMAYGFNRNGYPGPLTPAELPWYTAKGGAGPRHGVFHPALDIAYIINELDSTVAALRHVRGGFTGLRTVSTLPAPAAANTGAAVKISADGKYLYASNRGHDSITIFKNDDTGIPAYMDNVPSGGKLPRDFAIDPTGKFLLVTHQGSDNLTVFRIGPGGTLKQIGDYPVPSPVCVIFGAAFSR